MRNANRVIDRQVEAIFNRIGNGIQFNIMDLRYIDGAARNVLLAGGSLEVAEEAMAGAIEVYRVN
jgi:hypothetical protein